MVSKPHMAFTSRDSPSGLCVQRKKGVEGGPVTHGGLPSIYPDEEPLGVAAVKVWQLE